MKMPIKWKSRKPGAQAFMHRAASNPFVGWALIFVISLVAALILSAVGIGSYFNVKKQLSGQSSNPHAASAGLDMTQTDAVISSFDVKASEHESVINNGYAMPSDPSI